MTTTIRKVDLDQLSLSRYRPDHLPVPDTDLVDLVARVGISCLPMITARLLGQGHYEVVTGVLSCRVAQILGIPDLEIQLVDLDEHDVSELVRQDFINAANQDAMRKPILTGWYIRRQAESEAIKPTMVGRRLGLNRRDTSLCIRLTRLVSQVQDWVNSGQLSVALARRLVTLKDDQQLALATKAIHKHWSVRQLELILKTARNHSPDTDTPADDYNDKSDLGVVLPGEHFQRIKDEENSLMENLNTTVEVHHAIKGDGYILIHYHGLDEYSGIAERLRQHPQNFSDAGEFYI
mgnify:CR=1 FL=1